MAPNGENVSFNLQDFLQDMREEQKADHVALSKEVKQALDKIALHETRVVVLENSRANFIKGGWIMFGALVVFVFDLIKDHLFAASAVVKP